MELLHKRIGPEHFVPPLAQDSDFICSLCGNVLREPVLAVDCGHIFCKACLLPADPTAPRVPACPVDRTPLDAAKVFPDKRVERLILGREVKCANSPGCAHKGPLGALVEHLGVCSWEAVPCRNGCGESFARRDEGRHLGESCLKRRVPCPHCSGSFLHAELSDHTPRCPSAPVEFPNADCKHISRREDLPQHLREACAEEVLPCPLSATGCADRCSRGLLPHHFEKKAAQHAQLLQQALQDLKASHSEELKEVRAAHAEALSALRSDFDKKIENLGAVLREEQARHVQDIRRDYDQRIEKLSELLQQGDCFRKFEIEERRLKFNQVGKHSSELKLNHNFVTKPHNCYGCAYGSIPMDGYIYTLRFKFTAIPRNGKVNVYFGTVKDIQPYNVLNQQTSNGIMIGETNLNEEYVICFDTQKQVFSMGNISKPFSGSFLCVDMPWQSFEETTIQILT